MNRIKELRIENKMTQSELGKKLGVQDAAISKYESERVPLVADTIEKLCDIFNVSADYLLCKSDIKKPPEVKDNGRPDELASYSKETKVVMELLTQLNPENLDKAMDHLQYLLARQEENKDKK